MKRLAFGLFLALANPGLVSAAEAPAAGADETADDKSSEAETPAPEAPEAKSDALPDLSDEVKEAATQKEEVTTTAVSAQRSWEDIVVVPRKAFLKRHRLEIAPFYGQSFNDTLITHYAFGGDLTFYLTDAFSIGLQGQYFIKQRTERESLVGLQYNRVSTLNRYDYSASLVFGYVPIYGKFALFNKYIVHWDCTVNAGVGIIQTEIIPVNPENQSWTNIDIAPHIGASTRMFVTDWLTLSVGIRDYMFFDKYEPLNRGNLGPLKPDQKTEVDQAKANATSSFTQNAMVVFSLGLYLPPSIQYKTPR